MKIFTRLLSLAIVTGGLMVNASAKADTAFHRVYHQTMAVNDSFSILDEYQNNVLQNEQYRKGNYTVAFAALDANRDGFLSRSEFYGTRSNVAVMEDERKLSAIMPAAGGMGYRAGRYIDIVYSDDPCDSCKE